MFRVLNVLPSAMLCYNLMADSSARDLFLQQMNRNASAMQTGPRHET